MSSARRCLDFCSQLFNALEALLVRPENCEKCVSHYTNGLGYDSAYELLHRTSHIIVLGEVFLQRGYLILQRLQLCFLIVSAWHSRREGWAPFMDEHPVRRARDMRVPCSREVTPTFLREFHTPPAFDTKRISAIPLGWWIVLNRVICLV